MNGGAPCAAALYSDAHLCRDSFILWKLIGNKGPMCRGGGAAIMCTLIANSRNLNGEFSPLALAPFDTDPNLKRYFDSFGCFRYYGSTRCFDSKPDRCHHYANILLDADGYFEGVRTPFYSTTPKRPQITFNPSSGEEAARSNKRSHVEPTALTEDKLPADMSIRAAALTGFLASTGMLLIVLRLRRGTSTGDEELFLASES
eukprot:gnl/TRDRNA2_/TRDRNA2_150746_c0_seq1.p1 gnl/TRDRNA2_/TRDRNA2_150746_c0~~gnl/TRDRNA2_/TRDRNA2_150746_c0_seq1.p1  ORF type:complete len:202 (+),score=18.61 gnl/TRDRNA2_/TRDRNA2_150746_c0_seq1:64-669(+)